MLSNPPVIQLNEIVFIPCVFVMDKAAVIGPLKENEWPAFHDRFSHSSVGSSFFKVSFLCFSLSFMTVNDESLGFGLFVGERSDSKKLFGALENSDSHFFFPYIL